MAARGRGQERGSFGPLGGVCWEQQSISMGVCAWNGVGSDLDTVVLPRYCIDQNG